MALVRVVFLEGLEAQPGVTEAGMWGWGAGPAAARSTGSSRAAQTMEGSPVCREKHGGALVWFMGRKLGAGAAGGRGPRGSA